jgi:ribosome-associated protein
LISEKLAMLAANAADDKKAEDIIILNVGQKVSFTDYFVIASGSSDRQVDAICESIEEKFREEAGLKPMSREGWDFKTWVLLDYGDVVVHIFQPEVREYYQIETLFNDVDKKAL